MGWAPGGDPALLGCGPHWCGGMTPADRAGTSPGVSSPERAPGWGGARLLLAEDHCMTWVGVALILVLTASFCFVLLVVQRAVIRREVGLVIAEIDQIGASIDQLSDKIRVIRENLP